MAFWRDVLSCAMPDHTKLRVWHKSMDVTVRMANSLSPIISRRMPGVRSQLLRATSSIAANISEGASQATTAQYARFLGIAIGSASETESHLVLAIRLDVVLGNTQALVKEIQTIRKMLFRLRQRVEDSSSGDPPAPPTGSALPVLGEGDLPASPIEAHPPCQLPTANPLPETARRKI